MSIRFVPYQSEFRMRSILALSETWGRVQRLYDADTALSRDQDRALYDLGAK
jgi:hypothetical protein